MKDMMIYLAGMTMELLSKALDTIPERAKEAGMSEQEFFEQEIGKEYAWSTIEDIANDINQIPEGLEGREELLEKYEEIIEQIEKYSGE